MSVRITKYLFIVLIAISGLSFGQESADDNTVVNLEKIDNDNKRDEIQRYFGYEDLLFRYLTLPYDLSTNTNEQGRFVDFGFALFALLPLILLASFFDNKKFFYPALLLTFLYLCLCLSYSFFHVPGLGVVRNHAEFYGEFLEKSDGVIGHEIMKMIFELTYPFAQPFRNIGSQFSGTQDHITYPVLVVGFIIILTSVLFRKKLGVRARFLFILLSGFGFIWLILSSGIIWYGFFLVPLGYLIIGYFLSSDAYRQITSLRFVKGLAIVVLLIMLTMGYVGRISNIGALSIGSEANIGKQILQSSIYQYSSGMIGPKKAFDNSYANIGTALDQINSNDALIFQVGTFLAFDIEKNPQRIFSDQTLEGFFWLIRTIREKEAIIESLKTSGFKYIIVDLVTHTLDKTPEKSLTKKFQLLLNTLYENPSVQLLATDRLIEIENEDGAKLRQSGVFGKQIVSYGSYAIYEIL